MSHLTRTAARGAVATLGSAALVLAGMPAATAGPHGTGPHVTGPHGTGHRSDAVDLGHEVLPDDDGWGAHHGLTFPEGVETEATGTTGGSAAAPSEVYVVDTWQELRDALAGTPGGSQTDARSNEVPRIVYVNGTLDAFEAADGTTLTCDDFAAQVTVDGSGEPFSMDDYIAHYDPEGDWGWVDPAGPLEEARQDAARVQARQTQQHVGSNVSLVGVGDDARIVGANLRIRDAHNVIVRNLTVSDARDCFPEWDPGDTQSGNWNSAYDNVSVWTSTSVWIDHSTFDDGDHPPSSLPTVFGRPYEIHDGLLDITHGSDLVTVSYNRFENHDKTNLVGSSDGRTQDRGQHRVTYHHNHWIDIGQRAPRVRFGDVHVYNDLYEQTEEGLFQYFWGAGRESSLYAENNAFELAEGVDPGRIIAEWGGTRLFETGSLVDGEVVDLVAAFNATAEDPLEPTARWTPSDHYSYELLDPTQVAEVVRASAGAGVLDSGTPVADDAPQKVTLSLARGEDHRSDGDVVRLTARVLGPDQGTVVRLLEDGTLVEARRLDAERRGQQRATFDLEGRTGEHTYVVEVLNPHGVTASDGLTVDTDDPHPGTGEGRR